MKNWFFVFTFAISFLAKATFAQQNPPEQKLLIDIDNLSGGAISEIFAESEYIPLEDTKESLVNRIDKLGITKDFYIILDDKKPKKILIFNKLGKFVRKIAEVPGRKIEEDGFRELWIDQKKKEIITEAFWHKEGAYLVYFDLQGKFLRIEKRLIVNGDLTYLGSDKFADTQRYFQQSVSKYQENKDSVNYHLTFYDGEKVVKQFFPIDTTIRTPGMDDLLASGSGLDLTNNSVLFANTGNYTIQNVDVSGIKEVYNILFPLKNSLPQDIMTNKYNGKRYELINSNPNIVFGLQDIYKINNWLSFSAKHWSGGWNKIIYNLKTSTSLDLGHIQGDASNGFLPTTSYIGIVGADKENIYTTLSSADMFRSNVEMVKKNPVYSETLQNYFKNSSRLSNPVLIRLKLKSDF